MNYATIIPSRSRAWYPDKYRDVPVLRFKDKLFNTKLIVHESEAKAYEDMLRRNDCPNVTLWTHTHSNICQIRQGILNACSVQGYEYLCHPDDDVRYFDRELRFRSVPMELEASKKLWNHVMSIVSNRFPFVSTHDRFMIHACKYAYQVNSKALVDYFIHVPTFLENDIRFEYKDLTVYEDRVVQCQLGVKGFYSSLITSMYASSQRHMNNDKGGCADYRTDEENLRCARIVHADFPSFTNLHKCSGWSSVEAGFQFKKLLPPGHLPYIPKEEMEQWMQRPEACRV